ncbi:MAG TPA: PH domain-containing protein, partial [Acidimicrobiia bacterium]|nr:PH domain-containing protein [Acidimicrobiia bacterium]
LTHGESVVREFRPHWRLLFVPFAWTLVFAAAILLTWMYPPDNSTFDWVITGIAGVLFLRLGLYPFVAWWFTHYVLTNERLIRRSGILSRKGKEIPLENINDMSFSQSILERVLRSGDLLIESAGEQGQSVFADIPQPEQFQSLVYRVRELRAKELGATGRVEATDRVSQLERFAKLYKEGLISEEEYERQKSELLDGDG